MKSYYNNGQEEKHNHSKEEQQAITAFKSHLNHAKHINRFLYGRRTAEFARELSNALLTLKNNLIDPRKGVELVADFFRADEILFNKCDDSSGDLGDVFRCDACDLFVHYASVYNDKEWIADIILRLMKNDNYGVRDCLFDTAAKYLPESIIRQLVEQFWKYTNNEKDKYRQRHWLLLIELLAKQLRDPVLYEKSVRRVMPEIGITGCIDIAEVYFDAGETETALSWLYKTDEDPSIYADRRDRLLLDIYLKLKNKDKAAETAWQIFRRLRHETTFKQLLKIIGAKNRIKILEDEAKLILRSTNLSYSDAEFLIWSNMIDEAEKYILEHKSELNGDNYYSILPLAETMEQNERFLTATILYRALLESILTRAISKYYGYGVRYLRKLDELAPLINNWLTFEPHNIYFLKLLEDHKRKSSFWSRYESKLSKKKNLKADKESWNE